MSLGEWSQNFHVFERVLVIWGAKSRELSVLCYIITQVCCVSQGDPPDSSVWFLAGRDIPPYLILLNLKIFFTRYRIQITIFTLWIISRFYSNRLLIRKSIHLSKHGKNRNAFLRIKFSKRWEMQDF